MPPPEDVHPADSPSVDPSLTVRRRTHGRFHGWRLGLIRIALVLLAPTLFLAALEISLRCADYGWPTSFFLRSSDGRSVTENERFTWTMMEPEIATLPHPFKLTIRKPAGTKRVFVLGESAAMGTPDPAFGFARMLQVGLTHQYPDTRLEVVNAAVRGINSHSIRFIAHEAAALEPDAFVIYMGNNEAIGQFAPTPDGFALVEYPHLLRLVQWVQRSKTAQLYRTLARRISNGKSASSDDPEKIFHAVKLSAADPKRAAVRQNFRTNLREICRAGSDAGARVFLATVPVNLRDCPPLASVHRSPWTAADEAGWDAVFQPGVRLETAGKFAQALEYFDQAAARDGSYAELAFRRARCLSAVGRQADAAVAFTQARDLDALGFRTDGPMNEMIRETAGEMPRVQLVDLEHALAQHPASTQGVPGQALFYEHVHLRFDGDFAVAEILAPLLTATLDLGPASAAFPTKSEMAEALAFTDWDRLQIETAIAVLTAKPPFTDQLDHATQQPKVEAKCRREKAAFTERDRQRCLTQYAAAIKRQPDDWLVHYNFGRLNFDFGMFARAEREFARASELLPRHVPLRNVRAMALVRGGRRAEAKRVLEESLAQDPESYAARAALDSFRKANTEPAR